MTAVAGSRGGMTLCARTQVRLAHLCPARTLSWSGPHPFPPGAPFRGQDRTSTRQPHQRLRGRSAGTVATTTGGWSDCVEGRRVVGGDLWDCVGRTPFPCAPVSARRSLSWSGPHQYAPSAPEVTGAIGGYGSDDDGWLGPIAWRAAKGGWGDLWRRDVASAPIPLRTRFRPALPFVVRTAPVRAARTRGYGGDRRKR